MGIRRWFHIERGGAPRLAMALGWVVLACAVGGCPDQGPPGKPSPDFSLSFHIDPAGTQVVSGGQTLTYRVIVDSKGILNAGVEFETSNVKPQITASVNPARISETARETQLVVRVPPGTRADDYDFTLRGRLTFPGQGAADWTPTLVPLRVSSGESGFSLTCAGELALRAGAAQTLTCRTIREGGFTATINLSFASRPGYITIYPDTASVGPDVGGFAFTVVRSLDATTPAFYDLVATGRSAGLTRQSTTRLHFP
jgi:hypothetical protein